MEEFRGRKVEDLRVVVVERDRIKSKWKFKKEFNVVKFTDFEVKKVSEQYISVSLNSMGKSTEGVNEDTVLISDDRELKIYLKQSMIDNGTETKRRWARALDGRAAPAYSICHKDNVNNVLKNHMEILVGMHEGRIESINNDLKDQKKRLRSITGQLGRLTKKMETK